jgi:hypothetical protein
VLITTHVLSGALLGRAVGRPLPALVLGTASHLALDRLPHWGRGQGWPPADLDDDEMRVAVVDGLVGLALIAVVLFVAAPRIRPAVLAGIVGACAPDLDKPARRWLGASPWPSRFDRMHAELQVDVESPGLLSQDVAIAATGATVTVGVLARDGDL